MRILTQIRGLAIGAALIALLAASPACAQLFPGPGGGSGGSYTAGSGLTLTGTTFSLGDPNLTYSAGALATTSLALGGATLGANKLAVTGMVAITNTNTFTLDGGIGVIGSYSGNNEAIVLYQNGGNAPNAALSQAGLWIASSRTIGFGSASTVNSFDTQLYRDSAGVLADRNGTNAQALRVADSYTDASDYSWAAIVAGQTSGSESCAANTLCLGSWHLGTPGGGGSLTKLKIYADGTSVADYNSTTAGAWAFSGGASCTLTVVTHLTVVNGIVTLCN